MSCDVYMIQCPNGGPKHVCPIVMTLCILRIVRPQNWYFWGPGALPYSVKPFYKYEGNQVSKSIIFHFHPFPWLLEIKYYTRSLVTRPLTRADQRHSSSTKTLSWLQIWKRPPMEAENHINPSVCLCELPSTRHASCPSCHLVFSSGAHSGVNENTRDHIQ